LARRALQLATKYAGLGGSLMQPLRVTEWKK
jgi:hypothetical protein